MNSRDIAKTPQTENGADVGRVLLAWMNDSRPGQIVAATPNAAVAPSPPGD